MLKLFKKKSNTILISLFLCAALLFCIPAQAAQTSNTVIGTYGMTGANDFRLSYGKSTGIRSNSTETDIDNTASYKHDIYIDVPLTILWNQNCYINGWLKLNTYIQTTVAGTAIYSITRQCEIEYTPNNTNEFYSSAYIQNTTSSNGYAINIHLVASNFEAHAGSLYTFGWLNFHFIVFSPLASLNQIENNLTLNDIQGDMLYHWEYDPDTGISKAILSALEYEYENGTYADFMEDVLTYLVGLDQNAYDQTQLLQDIYNKNVQMYTTILSSNTYLVNILALLANFRTETNNSLTNIYALLGNMKTILEEIRDGPTEDTEAAADMESEAQKLESAGAELELTMPDFQGNFDDLDASLADPNITGATGQLYAWVKTPMIIEILTFTFMFGLVRFVFFGKGDS